MRLRRPHHFGSTLRDPHAAFHEVKENCAQQTHDQRNQCEVIEKPVEGQAEKIKAQIESEERVLLAERLPVSSHLVVEPVARAPLPDDVPNQ